MSVSDIFKMRDTIQIVENGGAGRWVKLMPGVRCTTTKPNQSTEMDNDASYILSSWMMHN